MKHKHEWMETLHLDNQLSLEDIPDLDLYMDQVIQLFEKKFADQKRNENEKILTKTMINNYAKGKLFFPIKNKKYSKEHLMLISMIYQMKGALSINDVKLTLERLNTKITDETFDLQQFYSSYLEIMNVNHTMFEKDLHEHMTEVETEVTKVNRDDEGYLEQVLLIATLTNMSNFYRKAAEKLVDEMTQKEQGDKNEA
ncbi:DUF1836 domain-containing protein [Oceanobacillus sp. FSL K6-2867]|uniref:DUF1836 domain-containing protein n=1 Tax=Oceanobacillus sp. FSL K6-2867 TaxID=2954748 RepID=UPI0030DC3FF8